jgi:transcriptional regulator with XRE-family HTH domain
MDDLRVGAMVRAVRMRSGLSQAEVATRADVSPSTVSLLERGHGASLSLAMWRRIGAVLEVRISMIARWRGGELDRLLSSRHSLLGQRFASFMLARPGWVVEPEISFSIWGERGVGDQLGWHAGEAHVLIVELKTEFVDINEMLGTLDRKRRLARQIAADRGWQPKLVSVWLIALDTHTNRRHAERHRALLRAALPLDGRALRGFLATPIVATSGLAFWPDSNPQRAGRCRSGRSGPERPPGGLNRSTSGRRGDR